MPSSQPNQKKTFTCRIGPEKLLGNCAMDIDLKTIIDTKMIQTIMDDFCYLTGMATAILDLKGTVIEATGWQDICTKFHRIHPETAKNCTESDLFLAKNLKPGEYIDYKCKNGLWDVVTPLYVGIRHVGNIYTGQFFYEEEHIDEAHFIAQADKYGFDRDAYIRAFRKIPRYNRKSITHLMSFLVKFATYISEIAFAKSQLENEFRERKQTEEKLKESEERLKMVLDGSQLGFWDWDIEADIVHRNERWAEIIGYTLDEIEENIKLWTDLHHPEDRKKVWQSIQDHLENRTASHKIEYRMRTKAGNYRWILDQAKIVKRDASGKPLRMSGTHTDITEIKKLQNRLNQTQQMEAIGTLAGGIAHDFNNMLSVIMGNISFAMGSLDRDHELYEILFDVEKSVKQAQSLTNQLLTFSKGGEPIKKITDVNKLINDAAIFSLRGSKSKCTFELENDLRATEIDEGQINQVIGNLIINANQAMPNGGMITVRTENVNLETEMDLPLPPGPYIRIIVEDQGIGISKKHIDNIFEPYFTTKQNGSGLGLATAYSIIKKHDGHISVYSELERGTVFNTYLPASVKTIKKVKEKTQPRHQGTGRILIMDDQESILRMVGRIVTQMGYEAAFATDGAQAVHMYKDALSSKKPFDLVILDLTVPGGMGGAKTIPELLKIDPKIKAIVSSGYSNDPIMGSYQDYGFCGVVPKPYSKNQLAEVLNKVFGPPTES